MSDIIVQEPAIVELTVNDTLNTVELNVIDSITLSDYYYQIASAPAHYNSSGSPGQIGVDDDYVYVCVSANKWIRVMGIKNF